MLWIPIVVTLALGVISSASARPQVGSVEFCAVGDVMLARGVQSKIVQNGVDWPFAKVKSTLRSSGITFCNLECPLSTNGVMVNKPICFKADPSNVKCLKLGGFDIVSLANNHTMDCGTIGLVETMHALDGAHIAYAGAGNNLADAALPKILKIHGLRIAFLARNRWMPEKSWPNADEPGIAHFEPDFIEREIRDAKSKADVVIVSLHWGTEYRDYPWEEQKEIAHKLVDAGASLVIGHHPHVLQPVERYHGGVIAYSLGNFLFDSPVKQTKKSMIFKCSLSKSGVCRPRTIPVNIVHFRPELMNVRKPS